MDILERLKAGKKNITTLNFPGTENEIALTVLTEAEVQEAIFEAERHFKKSDMPITATTLSAYNSEVNTQMLVRALVDPAKQKPDGTYERIFKAAAELRGLSTSAQKAELIEAYNAFEAECSPSPDKMSNAEFEKLFDNIKKNPLNGNNLSSATAKKLVLFLARQVSNSQKASGHTS